MNTLIIDFWKDSYIKIVFCYFILGFTSFFYFIFHLQHNQFDFMSLILCSVFSIIVFSLIRERKRNLTGYIYLKAIGYTMLPFFIALITNILCINVNEQINYIIDLFTYVYIFHLLIIYAFLLLFTSMMRMRFINFSFFQKNNYVRLSYLFILFPIFSTCFIQFKGLEYLQEWMIILYFFTIMIIVFLYVSSQVFNVQLKASCVNLGNHEILNTNIYSLVRKTKNYQIFKLDFYQLFPENSYNQSIYVLNKYCFNHKQINEKKTDEKNYIYLSIDKHNQNQELEIKYCYTIKDKGKEKVVFKKCDLYLEIRCYGSLVYISQYQFKNFRKMINQKVIHKYQCISQYPLEYHVLNAIKYCDKNGEPISIRKKEDSIHEYRKWLFHNNKFGMGKTTYDIYYAMEQGYQPVIVSPWEAHFDKDILQLIYLNMSNNHKEGFFAGISRKVFIFLAINMGALLLFFDNDIIRKIFSILYDQVIIVLFPKIKEYISSSTLCNIENIAFLVVSILLSIYFLPSILLVKNGDTEKYQGFYIERIKSMYNNNPNIFLIIEDVDRLDSKVQEEVFRILSLLNSHIHQLKVLGVISMDKKAIKIPGSKGKEAKKIFETIQNKIIYETIGEEYDYKRSIDLYLEEGIEFLCNYYNDKISGELKEKIETLKDEVKNDAEKNFRDAHKCMEEIIKEFNK